MVFYFVTHLLPSLSRYRTLQRIPPKSANFCSDRSDIGVDIAPYSTSWARALGDGVCFLVWVIFGTLPDRRKIECLAGNRRKLCFDHACSQFQRDKAVQHLSYSWSVDCNGSLAGKSPASETVLVMDTMAIPMRVGNLFDSHLSVCGLGLDIACTFYDFNGLDHRQCAVTIPLCQPN